MKAIDKNGKLFGKVSILDIIIVVCIVFVAAVFLLSRSGGVKLPSKTSATSEYSLELKAYSIDKGDISPFEVGASLYGSNGEYIGKITNIRSEPMPIKVDQPDGTFKYFDSEKSLDYYLTVDGSGKETDKGFFAQGTLGLFPNNSILVSSKNYYGNVVVLSVEKKV